MTFDYTNLDLPLTQTDIDAYKTYISKSRRPVSKYFSLSITVAIYGFIGIIFMPMIVAAFNGDEGAVVALLIVVGLVGLFTIFIKASLHHDERVRAKMYRFALTNNLQVAFDEVAWNYSGMIFDEGHSRQVQMRLTLNDETEIGNYQYVTGGGKSRSTHDYGYVKIKLARKLPHMVLDGKANNFMGFTGMSDTFGRSQQLLLEGDFNEHFTLYAPKEYERDALYVFTPDVMAALIEYGTKYDMEVVDDELYIYSNTVFDFTSKQELANLMTIISTIGSEIRSQTKRYSDEKVTYNPQHDKIAGTGQRLRKGISLVALLILCDIGITVGVSIIGSGMSETSRAVLYLINGIIIWVIIGTVIVRKFIKNR